MPKRRFRVDEDISIADYFLRGKRPRSKYFKTQKEAIKFVKKRDRKKK